MSAPERPMLMVETVGGVTLVTIAESDVVSEAVIAAVDEQLATLTGTAAERVVLNFREVKFMSSSLLAVLVEHQRRLARTGGRVKLCRVAPDLMVAFRITRFDRLFEFHDDEWSALDSFPAPARKKAVTLA